MAEQFTEQEKKILLQFCTNVDKDIFALKNLPEAIKGALFSRYSRSPKGLRRLLLDEFILDKQSGFDEIVTFQVNEKAADLKTAIKKAQDFYDRILDGYGDDSVGELGGAHVACENVSMIATKELQHARIGGSPLEKSTRYIYFDQKVNGKYLFCEEPAIMDSEFRKEYLELMNFLFDTYAELKEPMQQFIEHKNPLEGFMFFDTTTKTERKYSEMADEKARKRFGIAYRSSAKAKVCDVLRYILPTATITNVGIFGNGRFFQELLTKLYSHEAREMQAIAAEMHEELNHLIPSFIRRAGPNPYYMAKRDETRKAAGELLRGIAAEAASPVELVDYDRDAEIKLFAAMMYPHSNLPLKQLREKAESLSATEKQKLLDAYISGRKQRRDKPYRALENVYYTFDILGDYGMYRDLQRHRILTQERQLLTADNGFTVPPEIVEAGFEDKFMACMQKAARLYYRIAGKHPLEAQYVLPMAYRIRWYMKMNLREAFHFTELRSVQQGHQAYRAVAQQMFRKIQEVHPQLAKYMTYVDMTESYQLERLAAEVRKEEKKALREHPTGHQLQEY